MVKFLRLFLAVLAGLVVGSVVNMGLILVSGRVIPPPPGADVTTAEGLKASLHLFEARHFVFPFLAHALGTLSGAFAAGLLAPGRSALPASIVGGLFLAGGLVNAFLLPAPLGFTALDLVLAYVPAAWLGQALAAGLRGRRKGGAGQAS